MKYYELMTDKQREVFDKAYGLEKLKAEYIEYDKNYEEAKAAIIELPHLNERGESVLNGCNSYMRKISRYWLVKRDLVKSMLPREVVLELDGDPWLYQR